MYLKNLVDVMYFDYALYEIVLAYNQTIYANLRGISITIKDPNLLPDVLMYKNLVAVLHNSLKVKFDEEITSKIVYVKVLQILDKNFKDNLIEVNQYLREVGRSKILTNMKNPFRNTSDVLDWLDELYSSFKEPFLYTECMDMVNNQ